MANSIKKIVDELPKLPGKPTEPNKPANTTPTAPVLPAVTVEAVQKQAAEKMADLAKKNSNAASVPPVVTPEPTPVDPGKVRPVPKVDYRWTVHVVGKAEAPVITLIPIETAPTTPK